MKIYFIAGLSGSGKTTVMQVFSEYRYTILEGIPVNNISTFINQIEEEKICVIISEDDKDKFEQYNEIVEHTKLKYEVKTIYIYANDDVIITRFKELRKLHPLQVLNRKLGLEEAISLEEENQREFAKNADYLLDTSFTSITDLRNGVNSILSLQEMDLTINIVSFGVKYGNIKDADYIIDVRFLPNPHYIKSLKNKSGLDKEVYDYVFSFYEANEFYDNLLNMMLLSIEGFNKMKKLNITIAFACTGGQHRSVSFAERLASDLKQNYKVNVKHLEHTRGNW